MDLNAGAMDDLTGLAVEDDLIVPPGVQQTADEKHINVTVPGDQSKASVPSEQMLNEMGEAEVSFNLVKDNVSHVVMLSDINEQVLGQESISRDDAAVIDDVYGGFLGQKVSIEEFSQQRTKTNFAYSARFMQQRIATESQAAVASFQNFIQDSLDKVKATVEAFKNQYVPSLRNELVSIQGLADKLRQRFLNNPKLILVTNDGFCDILNVDLNTLDFSTIRFNGTNLSFDTHSGGYQKAIENIRAVIASPRLRSSLNAMINHEPLDQIFSLSVIGTYSDTPVTLKSLISLFGSSETYDVVFQFTDNFIKQLETIDSLRQLELQGEQPDFKVVQDFLVTNNSRVTELVRETQFLCQIVHSLQTLRFNSEVLFELIDQIQN